MPARELLKKKNKCAKPRQKAKAKPLIGSLREYNNFVKKQHDEARDQALLLQLRQ